MSKTKVVALRDFTIFEPAVSPATKETRREFRTGDVVEVGADQARDWSDKGLVGEPARGESLNEENTAEE